MRTHMFSIGVLYMLMFMLFGLGFDMCIQNRFSCIMNESQTLQHPVARLDPPVPSFNWTCWTVMESPHMSTYFVPLSDDRTTTCLQMIQSDIRIMSTLDE